MRGVGSGLGEGSDGVVREAPTVHTPTGRAGGQVEGWDKGQDEAWQLHCSIYCYLNAAETRLIHAETGEDVKTWENGILSLRRNDDFILWYNWFVNDEPDYDQMQWIGQARNEIHAVQLVNQHCKAHNNEGACFPHNEFIIMTKDSRERLERPHMVERAEKLTGWREYVKPMSVGGVRRGVSQAAGSKVVDFRAARSDPTGGSRQG